MKTLNLFKKKMNKKRLLSISRKLYSNNFLTWVFFTGLIFSAFSIMDTYAQVDDGLRFDTTEAYEEVIFNKQSQGYDEETSIQSDMFSNINSTIVANAQIGVSLAAPQVLVGYEDALASAKANGREPSIFAQKGILGSITDANVAMVGSPPSVNLVAFMAEEWVPGYGDNNSGIYAQESGYSYLTEVNIADIWQTTRMIAYSLFVIALIIAGFMIMFRQKIGGQVSVTVFNTIPKVIMGLILVTFSFAIVGLVMDFGALLIRVISGFLVTDGDAIVVSNPFSLALGVWNGEETAIIRQTFGISALTGIVAAGVSLISPPAGIAIGSIGAVGMILVLVFVVILVWASVKVFVTMLKAWIGIIVDTVMGPLFLAIAVIPGRSSIGSDWFRRIVKNVLTFVGVFFLLNLAGLLASQNVQFFFPAGLAGGEMDTAENSALLTAMMNAFIPLFLFFTAAEVPKFLDDFLPTGGGKGAGAAFANVQKSFAKIPIVGGAFG